MGQIYDNKWDFVLEYLPIAKKMAESYRNSLISYDDLYQEACFAIYDSISDYDSDRGISLSSFLMYRIRYRFYDLFAQNKFEVYVPLNYCRQAFRLHRLQQRTKISTGEYLSNKEAGEILNLSEITIETLDSLNRRMIRHMTESLPEFYVNDVLENSVYDDNSGEEIFLESMISDSNVEADFIQKDLVEDAMRQIENLSEKRKKVILYRLGFITGEKEKFKTIAKIMGGTPQNAKQQYSSGIKSLRKMVLGE